METKNTVKREIADSDELPVNVTVAEVAGREIYENITQCLCLARLQLSSLDPKKNEELLSRVGEANLLIGKAVKDLRNLAKTLIVVQTALK